MFLARLLEWWRGRQRPSLARLQVVMFTRRGCHLCETAWSQLLQAQREYGFQLQAVNIDAEPRLVELHNDRVPVVAIDGKVRFWGRLNSLLLHRLLDAEARRRPETKKPPDSHPGA